MTPQEKAEWKAQGDKDIARIERQERWLARGRTAGLWLVYGFWVYVLLTDHLPAWFLIVVLTAIFVATQRDMTAERKREEKRDQLRSDLIDLDIDRDYESAQARWDAYYFNVTGYHPNSTITLSRRSP
jgi:hypothetical protein